jgi:energy-coupling factor transporter ATP-binding protein EcfA2
MRIHIKNFQSLGDVEIEAEGLTVLVGRSNLGKSAFVRALSSVLFNRPGDEFIRLGESRAVVTLDGVTGVDGREHTISWTRQRNGSAEFIVDGEGFTKLGGAAPPPVVEAGFRDVWIGDRERRKGEYIRPQLAAQMDPVFLLTRTGSFIADVLNLASRHAVIVNAQDRAGTDLTRERRTYAGLRESHASASARLEPVKDAPAFRDRVEALSALRDVIDEAEAKIQQVRRLLALRQRLLSQLAEPLPSVQPTGRLYGALTTLPLLRTLARRRPLWGACSALPQPERTAVAAAVLVGEARIPMLRALAALRGRVWPVTEMALPSRVKMSSADRRLRTLDLELPERAKALTAIRSLTKLRPALRRVAVLAVPPPVNAKLDMLDNARRLWSAVAALWGTQRAALDDLFRRQSQFNAVKVDAEAAEAELLIEMGKISVCPLCRTVMVGEANAVPR